MTGGPPLPTTLVTGARSAAREAAIAGAIQPQQTTAVILEGLPDGSAGLQDADSPHLFLARIAPGCPCCTGNTVMRVTLNRMLRRAPDRLYIGVASIGHLEQIRDFLRQSPYDALLTLTEDLQA